MSEWPCGGDAYRPWPAMSRWRQLMCHIRGHRPVYQPVTMTVWVKAKGAQTWARPEVTSDETICSCCGRLLSPVEFVVKPEARDE